MKTLTLVAVLLALSLLTAQAFEFRHGQVKPKNDKDKDTNKDKDEGHPSDEPKDDQNDDEEQVPDYTDSYVKYYLNGIKGIWTGFVRGFYHDSKMELNERCLSEKLTSNIWFMNSFMRGEEPMYKVVKFVTTSAKIFNDNMQFCGYSQLVTDMEAFCATGGCHKKQIMKNFTDRMF